jgi:hypothetical protein
MIDDLVSDDASHRLRALVAGRSLANRESVPLESVDLDEAMHAGPDSRQVTDRLEASLGEAPDPELARDPVEYRRALDILLRATREAASKLDADPTAPLTRTETMVFEAVVRTDGSRPSLLVRDGGVNSADPTARDWSGTFDSTAAAMKGPISAVGRVEPATPSARSYFGTCWVVDAGQGVALTNRHVVEAIWRRLSFRMQRTATGFRILDGAFVDFVAESGSTRSNRFKVVEAVVPAEDGPGLQRLDAAVLKMEPAGGGELPPAIPVRADPDGPAGNLFSFCVVGYPGPPPFAGGIHEGVDWTWVNTTLFGNRYGVKRLAPGVVHRPVGSIEDDPRHWVFGHDPTTLGGSSGSPMLNWLDPAPSGFGLHFAGISSDSNFAHAVSAAAAGLAAIGVPVAEPGP